MFGRAHAYRTQTQTRTPYTHHNLLFIVSLILLDFFSLCLFCRLVFFFCYTDIYVLNTVVARVLCCCSLLWPTFNFMMDCSMAFSLAKAFDIINVCILHDDTNQINSLTVRVESERNKIKSFSINRINITWSVDSYCVLIYQERSGKKIILTTNKIVDAFLCASKE